MENTKYFKMPNYRLLIKYPDGTSWDVPAFSGFPIDEKVGKSPMNHFWGTEEEWDLIEDSTEIFPPERIPQITEQSSRMEIMDFGKDEVTTLNPDFAGLGYLDSDGSWKTIKMGEPDKVLIQDKKMENNYWELFRANWRWKSTLYADGYTREEPLLIALKDMDTDHIIRCMLYPLTHNFTPNISNTAVFLTELLYRNNNGE